MEYEDDEEEEEEPRSHRQGDGGFYFHCMLISIFLGVKYNIQSFKKGRCFWHLVAFICSRKAGRVTDALFYQLPNTPTCMALETEGMGV